jgi:serine/threonine protein kinase
MSIIYVISILDLDLKPENILLSMSLERSKELGIEVDPKLNDFGIAKIFEGTNRALRALSYVGSPGYTGFYLFLFNC